MLIDWFTVSAQVVNFLILVWLMKRFLYKPILRAIDAREKRIAAELADADRKRAEAAREREQFEKKNEAFEQQRAELLSKATKEVEAERHRLLDEAAKAADAQRAKRQQALEREEQNLSEEITRRTREEVFAIARKALTDLAGESLEATMSDVFAHRVRDLNSEAKESLARAIETSSDPAVVRSAFDLPSEQRTAIQHALNDTFAVQVPLRFDTVPGVISGIEFSVNGQKVAWSIEDYLVSLEESVRQLLKAQSRPHAKAEVESTLRSETVAPVPEEAK
jgi:F-type H+-transporting ATPase subunit b